MKTVKKSLMALMILIGTCVAPFAAFEAMAAEGDAGLTATEGAEGGDAKPAKKGGFYEIVFGEDAGLIGTLLWFTLFGDGALAIYFCIDCMIMIKPEKLMPKKLLDKVQASMAEGDIASAIEACQNTPSVMSNILLAAFQHVEEGFDVIQEAVTAASDLEQEKLGQRLNWISVCSNLGPSLGLLGTVQGMIGTFEKLASGSAGDASALASSIGMALWTTAAGLIVSIPSLTAFYSLRNNANRHVLRMTAVTMEFLNGLRNVEVGGEEEVAEYEEEA